MENINTELIESLKKEFNGDSSYHSGVNDGMYALYRKLIEIGALKTFIAEQGEYYNDAELFLMDKLQTEILPKHRVILDAYEIAEWMEEYHKSHIADSGKMVLTDEEIDLAFPFVNEGLRYTNNDILCQRAGAKWMRNKIKE